MARAALILEGTVEFTRQRREVMARATEKLTDEDTRSDEPPATAKARLGPA
ncbi:hypothetical protein ACRAKI_08680 [Saccharothrix isguenensis]